LRLVHFSMSIDKTGNPVVKGMIDPPKWMA
jgi:hypothetical protein